MHETDDLVRRAELYATIIATLLTVEPQDRQPLIEDVLRHRWDTQRTVARVWCEVEQPAYIRVIGEET